MPLDREAQEFNEKQKRLQEYYQTEGRGLSRVEDELKRLNTTLGYLLDTILQWIEDEAKRRYDENRRSTYGMWDPQKYRTKRDEYSKYEQPWRTPGWTRHDPPVPPYDPAKDLDRDSFDEGVEDGKEEN